jgi:MYXO-CTERM domain-containing protein
MFTKSTRLNALISIAFFVGLSACGDIGAGCGCTAQPLPGGKLPSDQTVEGGGQVRVTQAGFQKLTSIIGPVVNDMLAAGFCVPQGSVGGSVLGAEYCNTNQAGTPSIPDSCGGGNGCNVGIHMDSVQLQVTSQQALNLKVQLDVNAVAHLRGNIFGAHPSCDMNVNGNNLFIDADILFDIDPADGELNMHLGQINTFDSSGLNLSNCGFISDLGNLVNDILNSFIGEFVIDLLTPTLDGLVQGFLPDPLGIEGLMDLGGLVGGISSGTEATMEARMVPGGYVQLTGGGMSLGLITGINADEDTSTRTMDLDSEPALCVPPIPAPDFAAAPALLPRVHRSAFGAAAEGDVFSLAPAGAFLGAPEPADDLAIGLSETTLDQAGHHLVTSGAMCLGVGTSLVKQLNLGTFSLLVPSLALLGEPENPILLVTRPQKALDFTVGEGTEASPALTIGIHSFEVDIYVFIYERYVRAFSMRLDLDLGVNLVFDQQPGMPATVTPELIGLDADNVTVAVLNNEFVAESQADLEAILPTIFDLAAGLLGDGLGQIEVPSFAGFSLNNLRVQKVTTSEDDFMAIYASLGSSASMREMAEQYPSLRPVLDNMDRAHAAADYERAPKPHITVSSVDTPAVSSVRMALKGHANGRLPAVTLNVPATDEHGHALEYAWRLASGDNAGLWRPFQPGGDLVIADRAFAWQGKYDIELRSRLAGNYHSTSEIASVPVIIDSVGPEILVDDIETKDGALITPARDIVSPRGALEWAWGRAADEEPWTDWQGSSSLSMDVAEDLVVNGQIAIYVRDEAGNTSRKLGAIPFHGQAGESGCSCNSSGAPSSGALLLVLLTGGLLFRRRVVVLVRAHGGKLAAWTGIVVGTSLFPGCSCGSDTGVEYCEVTEDCESACPDDEIPFCLDGTCVCIEDVPYGRIGPFSDVAVGPNGDAWVSAYAETHGDLVVATATQAGRIPNESWEFVDGVPDGPVAIPDSDIRGGILEEGPDVGMHTSIAVAADGTPMVTYYDRDTGSLKFAAKYGGTWSIHTIDDGTGDIDPELGGESAGVYSAITLRSDNGNPGVAYMALTSQGGGVTTAEVRFASAQTATPQSAADWVFFAVDSSTLPPVDPETADPTPLPGGVGLFIEATRAADQTPVLAYYDRANGDLKLARLDAQGGAFTTEVLDGGDDVGWYPGLTIGDDGTVHVSYVSATHDDLLYINTMDRTRTMIDDGYRIVGTTEDGLPKPEFHFVGEDSNIVLSPSGPAIIYQDATTHELLFSMRDENGVWQRRVIAGDEADFAGAYGFFASAAKTGDEVVISNWVIDQPHSDQWVEIFRERISIE